MTDGSQPQRMKFFLLGERDATMVEDINDPTKRAGNAVSLHQRTELRSVDGTPGPRQCAQDIWSRGYIVWLMAAVKVLWARSGTDKSPTGRGLKEMVLTHGREGEPDRNDVPLVGRPTRKHLGYEPCPQLPRVTGYSPALQARVEEIHVDRVVSRLKSPWDSQGGIILCEQTSRVMNVVV